MNAHFSFCLGQMERLEADIDGSCGFEPHSGLQVSENKIFISRSLVKIEYCGEPT